MKKLLCICLCVLLCLTGCSGQNLTERALSLRTAVQQAKEISFVAHITADFQAGVCAFTLQCCRDRTGAMTFRVLEPETVEGITGTLGPQGGQITFDGLALDFGLLSQQMPTPVSAPFVLLQALTKGNIRSVSSDRDILHLVIDESFASDTLQTEVYVQQLPFYAEISYRGRRLLTVELSDFKME